MWNRQNEVRRAEEILRRAAAEEQGAPRAAPAETVELEPPSYDEDDADLALG